MHFLLGISWCVQYLSNMTRSDPQFTEAEKPPARKRTSDDRQRKDRYSVASRWAGLRARTREGKLLKATRADLTRHVGGAPSVTQRVLIERASMLVLQLAMMDARALETGEMSEHSSRQYLAWTNTLAKTLRHLGLQAASARQPTVAEVIAAHKRPAAP